jgi:hypothetical protein
MGRHKVTFYGQDAQLKEIRAEDPEQYGRWAFSCERAAIRRLDRAFQRFFDRVKAGGKPGYPRFKGRGWWDSIEWPAAKGGGRWDSVPHPKVTRVYLAGVGHVRVHQHRAVKGRVKTITAKREGGYWYVVLSPALVTMFLFQFVAIWNNFFLPLVMLSNTRLYPVTLGLYTWNNEYGQAPQLVSYVIIGSLISVIPLVIAFLSLQRFWRSGLAAGSITL